MARQGHELRTRVCMHSIASLKTHTSIPPTIIGIQHAGKDAYAHLPRGGLQLALLRVEQVAHLVGLGQHRVAEERVRLPEVELQAEALNIEIAFVSAKIFIQQGKHTHRRKQTIEQVS